MNQIILIDRIKRFLKFLTIRLTSSPNIVIEVKTKSGNEVKIAIDRAEDLESVIPTIKEFLTMNEENEQN